MDALNVFLNDINAAWATGNTLVKTLLAIVTTMLVFYLLRYVVVRKLEKLTALTDNDFDDRFVHFLRQFLWLAVLFMGLVWVLQINGIKVGPVLAGAGIFGIAIGLAAKETLADILAGIFLIADRPIRIGDRIMIDKIGKHWGGWGDVIDIGLRRTTIRNTDGVIVNYPNAVLASSTVKNFSMDPQPMRVRIRFQTDFSADPVQVKAVTLKMIDQVDGIIPGSGTVVIRSIWDDEQGHMLSGVLYEARYRLEDVKRRTVIRSEVLERLISAFKAEEIPMAAVPIRKV
ncbi:mechanosensitive ion channel family protein [Leucothrix mucor]|uniref:mechanosensitive ion channel family protein n=1 Tax=Leucothrix mucor TaxID=45248 RepID=UPI0003B615E9|nr:mechanosensitive ion channel domain-containing protein [Leucothrix mucor]